jgi:hypothetical protein
METFVREPGRTAGSYATLCRDDNSSGGNGLQWSHRIVIPTGVEGWACGPPKGMKIADSVRPLCPSLGTGC